MGVSFGVTSSPAGPVAPRTGVLDTPHGRVHTPVFMPVGTLATVKSLTPGEVAVAGAEILLVNAYHLYLRPGHDLLGRLGGVHRFMAWNGPVLSDSGGFQVFSLATMRSVGEHGVRFRSHIDGSEHEYTPELAMEVQRALGVDIAMPLDHVVAGGGAPGEAREAAERTVRWYERSRAAAGGLTVFPIVQGGTDAALRRWHAATLRGMDAPGYAIGGLSVGEAKESMWATVEVVCEELPVERPRYLMGVGSPEDLVNGVLRGVDMFDCVLPTRLGRTGALFTDGGRLNIRNSRFREDGRPLMPGFAPLEGYSWAYLHHLFRNEELLGYRLASLYNVRYLVALMERLRLTIGSGTIAEFAQAFLAGYRATDESVRTEQRARWRSSGGSAAAGGGGADGERGPGDRGI